jgi:hypothetical protein
MQIIPHLKKDTIRSSVYQLHRSKPKVNDVLQDIQDTKEHLIGVKLEQDYERCWHINAQYFEFPDYWETRVLSHYGIVGIHPSSWIYPKSDGRFFAAKVESGDEKDLRYPHVYGSMIVYEIFDYHYDALNHPHDTAIQYSPDALKPPRYRGASLPLHRPHYPMELMVHQLTPDVAKTLRAPYSHEYVDRLRAIVYSNDRKEIISTNKNEFKH